MRRLNLENLKKLNNIRSRYSYRELYYKVREKLAAPWQDYNEHIQEYLPSDRELEEQRRTQQEFAYRPLVSIVVPAYETPEEFLRQMIDSCVAQTYENWELCIADGSRTEQVEAVVKSCYGQEDRVRYLRLSENRGISGNTNQGFEMAEGDYIALLDHDDFLVQSALFEMVKAINETGADFLYSDEDKVTADSKYYMDPHFKLDFNRELLLGNNYICHFLMVSRKILMDARGLDSRYDGAQDFDFVRRCSEKANRICHVPEILYHWRVHSGSTAGNADSKRYAYEAGKHVVEEWVKSQGWHGTTEILPDLGFYRTRYEVTKGCKLGIYIWPDFKESDRLPRKLGRQLEAELGTLAVEPVWERERLWEADYVLILQRDAQRIKAGSIAELLGSCGRSGIGAAGARTVDRRKVVQCGYWKKDSGYEARFQGLNRHYKGYMRRACLPVEVDAIGADLAVIDGSALRGLAGGLTEAVHRLGGKERQGDWFLLCDRLKDAGYAVIVDPGSEAAIRR